MTTLTIMRKSQPTAIKNDNRFRFCNICHYLASLLQQLQSHAYQSKKETNKHDLKTIRKPNNAWNYRGQRKRLSHLVKHPPSQNNQMGTRDISFIHDGQHYSDKPQDVDKGETLLPSNFHLVRSQQVAGLETYPGQHTTHVSGEISILTLITIY